MTKQLKTLLCGLTMLFWGISLTAQQDWQLLPLNQVTFWENQLGEVDMIYSDTMVIDSQGQTIQLVGGEYFKSGLGVCVDTLYNHFRYLTTEAFYPNDYTPLRRIVLPLPDSLITTSDKYIWYNGKDSFWIKKNIALGDKWTIQCHSSYCDSISFECVGRTQELALDFLDSVITIQPQAWLNGVMTNRFDSMDIKLSKTAGLFKMITPTGLYKDTTPRNWTIYGFKRPQDYIRYGYTNCPADYIWPCAVGDKLKYKESNGMGGLSSPVMMDSVIQITYTADSVIARVDRRGYHNYPLMNGWGQAIGTGTSYIYEYNKRLSFPLNYNTSRWARKPSYSLTGSYVNIYYKTPEGFLHQTITFACSQRSSQIGCEIDSLACNWFQSYATSRRDIGAFNSSTQAESWTTSNYGRIVCGYERCGVVYGDRRLLLSNENVNLREWTYKAYPSPTSGLVHINLPQAFDGSVHIYNTLGQLMLSQKINTSSNEVDLSSLEIGLYHAVFYENGGIVGNTNVIKN